LTQATLVEFFKVVNKSHLLLKLAYPRH